MRRLGLLGVEGNQPALNVFVQATAVEKEMLTRSIVVQKIGSNAKAIKEYDEWAERQRGREQVDDEADTYLIKYARVASGATVRWKRKVAENADSHVEEQTAE